MKKLALTFIGVCVLAGLAYAASEFSSHDKHWSWRYKITVEIDTPEGIKSGSAVRQVEIRWKAIGWSEINNEPHYSTKYDVSGEAVVVDLGERGTLFSTINDRSYVDAKNAFGIQNLGKIPDLPLGSKATFDPNKYPGGPTMVTFTDMSDAKTVTPVMVWSKTGQGGPYKLVTNQMEEIFGEGVSLKKIEIEITDEPKTQGIAQKLLWLNELQGGYLHGGFSSRGSPLGLYAGNFSRGSIFEIQKNLYGE